MAQTSVKLHPLARESLAALKARLNKEIGMSASREEIVGALVHGATPSQLFGMVLAFKKDAALWDEQQGEPVEPGE
jgi:hypothetical protein